MAHKKCDYIIAAVMCIVFFVAMAAQLTPGMANWGDDFAAYISEGIAISQGTLSEQSKLNYIQHPDFLPEEASGGELVYVWGFPLMLSWVYELVGFDFQGYGSIIFYKVPSVICFALFCGVLYLFYRRFFSGWASAVLVIMFAANQELMYSIDIMSVDIVFMFATTLSFWLAECYFDVTSDRTARSIQCRYAIMLGVALWFTYETRLNGMTVLAAIAAAHAVRLKQRNQWRSAGEILWQMIPYGVFLLLKVISEWVLMPATSNTSQVGRASLEQILSNLQYYYELTKQYIYSLSGYTHLFYLLCLFLAVGLITEFFRWKNITYTLLLSGTYVVLLLLPYVQGLRYLYGILPLFPLFAAYGVRNCIQWLKKFVPSAGCFAEKLAHVGAAVFLVAICIPMIVKNGAVNIQNFGTLQEDDVYSVEAVDMYHYIQENVAEDDIIAFVKPRALSLNTGRTCICPGTNGHDLQEADYFLFGSVICSDYDLEIRTELEAIAPPLYENEKFSLYAIN